VVDHFDLSRNVRILLADFAENRQWNRFRTLLAAAYLHSIKGAAHLNHIALFQLVGRHSVTAVGQWLCKKFDKTVIKARQLDPVLRTFWPGYGRRHSRKI